MSVSRGVTVTGLAVANSLYRGVTAGLVGVRKSTGLLGPLGTPSRHTPQIAVGHPWAGSANKNQQKASR